MKITEKVEKKYLTDALASVQCDGCKKDITAQYFAVTTQHDDWGNDSHESVQEFEFCSAACLTPHMTKYLNAAQGTDEYTIKRKVFRKGIEE